MNIDEYRNQTMGTAVSQSVFLNWVYGWMTSGLLLTGVVAFWISTLPVSTLNKLMPMMTVFLIAELITVMVLSWGLRKISATAAILLFFVYAALNGVTMSVIFLAYELGSVAKVFFITTATFGAMSVVGYTTKRDLSGLGTFFMMGLIGLIIAGIVNIFWYNSMAEMVICVIGVLLFVGLTAYDTQKIKLMAMEYSNGELDTATARKISIIGALELYLDFVNMFLYLLRLMGRRR